MFGSYQRVVDKVCKQEKRAASKWEGASHWVKCWVQPAHLAVKCLRKCENVYQLQLILLRDITLKASCESKQSNDKIVLKLTSLFA